MKLFEMLNPGVIKIAMQAADKDEAFEELIDVLVRAGTVRDREAALRAIYEREEKRTTGIGNGVAIPHGKDPSIERITAAAATSRKGIEFGSIDGKPVHLIFLVLAEPNNPGPHLQALSEIAACLTVPGMYDRLVNAKTAEEFLSALALPDAGLI